MILKLCHTLKLTISLMLFSERESRYRFGMHFVTIIYSHFADNKVVSSARPSLKIIQDEEFRRNMSTVDMNTALRLYNTDR